MQGAIQPTANVLIQSLLFFFVFGMAFIQSKIESLTAAEYRVKAKKIRVQRLVVLLTFWLVYYPVSMVNYFFSDDLNERDQDTLLLVLTIYRPLHYLIVCTPMFYKFLTHFGFFIQLKKFKLEQAGKCLSTHNKIVIVWVLLMWAYKVVYLLINVFLITAWHFFLSLHSSQSFSLAFTFLTTSFVYLGDLLVFLTLMYLFFCQGALARKLNTPDELSLSTKNILYEL